MGLPANSSPAKRILLESQARAPEPSSPFELRLQDIPRRQEGHGAWEELYGGRRPLRIEIGVGNSAFLVEVARRAPAFHYLGFEYSRKRAQKFLRKVESASLTCVRMLCVDASLVLEELIEPGSVDHLYVNHPDPWPKRRHAKNRLIQPAMATLFRRLMRPGGGLSLRTDARAYALQMLEVLDTTPGLSNTSGPGRFAPAPREPYSTPFEFKFRARGLPIYYLEYEATAVDLASRP